MLPKNELRIALQNQRRQLSPAFVKNTSQNITEKLMHSPIFKNSQHIALYFPFDNEVDITAILDAAEKHFYLPVITDSLHLLFAHYQLGQPLTTNRFGIPEPLSGQYIAAADLDLVCLPLVGFDRAGYRLGTGGGYYDRTFAFKKPVENKPWLLGIAYECQKTAHIPTENWDIRLGGVQTERKYYDYRGTEIL